MYTTAVTYTKIVSLPTNHAWSQTYSAGNLAALLSLTFKNPEQDQDKDRLQSVGRDLLSILEAEYFTLETKTLNTIKQAITNVASKVPEDIHANIIIATLVDTKAYVLLWGGGKIFIKRDQTFGLLLEAKSLAIPVEILPTDIESASGIIQPGDLIFLASEQLLSIIPEQEFLHYFVNQEPSEGAEQLEPLLHHKRQGGASAIIIQTHHLGHEAGEEETIEQIVRDDTEEQPIIHSAIQNEINAPKKPVFSLPRVRFTKRTILFGIAASILVLLLGLIIRTLSKQPAVNAILFQSVYSQASSNYDEGQNLETLNRPAAYDDYIAAQKLLNTNKALFPADTKEGMQIVALLAKINAKIAATSGMNVVLAKPVPATSSELLHQKMIASTAEFITQEGNHIYLASNENVSSYNTDTKQTSILFTRNTDWTSLGGLGVFFDTVYLVDKTKGTIFKFTKSGSTYTKSSYFPSSLKFDFSTVTDIAIDGSVWMLEDNGSLTKYTRAKQDSFTVKGLEKPFAHATKIVTTTDDNAHLYILDNGNSRIVVLGKDGTYIAQYSAAILKDATEIDVHQADKTAFILSGGKVYQISL